MHAMTLHPDGQTVLRYAAEEAERLGLRYIGTEHILIGIIRLQPAWLQEILTVPDLDAASLRQQLAALQMDNPHSAAGSLSPRARRVVLLAGDEARRYGHPAIEPQHLLLALLLEQESLAAGLLEARGVSLRQAQVELQRSLQHRHPTIIEHEPET